MRLRFLFCVAELEELFGHLHYYNAFCGREMKCSSSAYTVSDLDDINQLPTTPDDIPIGAFASEVSNQQVQQWYSTGDCLAADEAAQQQMLAIQEGTGHEDEADQQMDRQRAALMEVAIVYGPFGACKGGHVFVDSPGVGDRNMQRRRRTNRLLGPVADGGTRVVVAMFPTNLEAAASLLDTLHENGVFEASFSGMAVPISCSPPIFSWTFAPELTGNDDVLVFYHDTRWEREECFG